MSGILEQPVMRAGVYPLSVEAYHALGRMGFIPEQTELLYGHVFPKMPKTPLHRFLTEFLVDRLRRVAPAGWWASQEQPLTIASSEPEPDVSLVEGDLHSLSRKHPSTARLVIEVAIATVERDMAKRGIYAGAGVPEYWIVLGEQKQVEVYTEPEGEDYKTRRVFGAGDVIECLSVPGFVVRMNELFPPA